MKVSPQFSLWFALSLALASVSLTSAHASHDLKIKSVYVLNSEGVKIKKKEKLTYSVEGGWKHVTKVKIKVKAEVPGFSVRANGTVRRVTFYPGIDPYYLAEVNEAIHAIELMNGDLDCILNGIYFDAYDRIVDSRIGHFYGSFPSHEVNEILQSVQELSRFVSLEQQQQFIQPIAVAAGRALAVAYGRGDVSMRTGQAISALIAQIDFAEAFLTEKMSIDATYGWTVKLLSHKERLSDMID